MTFLRPAASPGVVSFRASWLAGSALQPGDDLLLRLVVRLLDKGTQRRGRFEIAEWLEGRGASLGFYSDGLRAGFSGRALRVDLPGVLALAEEQRCEPAFDPEEVSKAKAWLDAAYRGAEEDSGEQADAALARALYAPAHPSYEPPFEASRARLATFTREQVVAAHAEACLRAPVTLALGGDVHDLEIRAFAASSTEEHDPAPAPPARRSPGATDVPLPGKASLDVRLGHGVALRRTDPDFLPLRAAVFALGGNFSGRLMQTVRDEHGLTYGIGAHLSGVDRYHDGHFLINVTLSPENLGRGVDVTREVLAALLDRGIEEQELAQVRTTLAGTHVVGLSTSGGTASALLHAVEQGLGVAYLDALPERLAALGVDEVNAALRRHLDPGALHLVRAGTFRSVATP